MSCSHCGLIYIPFESHLNAIQEQARYEEHNNNIEDAGYRNFLMTLAGPMLEALDSPSLGLDFGSGPAPSMAPLFEAHGHHVTNYDPYFANDASVLSSRYDFSLACEVVEHFSHPRKSWELLWHTVKLGGLLGFRTSVFEPSLDFLRWHYITDPTHVAFYRPDTLTWLAQWLNATPVLAQGDVHIFKKEG